VVSVVVVWLVLVSLFCVVGRFFSEVVCFSLFLLIFLFVLLFFVVSFDFSVVVVILLSMDVVLLLRLPGG